MPARLDRAIKRSLEIDGEPYTVTISPDGVKIVAKGKRKGHEMSWRALLSGDAELTRQLKMSIDAFEQ